MGSKVEVTYEELIKPSSPTPNHLRKYELSFLDQTASTYHGPFLFFYTGGGEHENMGVLQKSLLLKQSLSIALTLYYPLAGRIVENDFIDCNDVGAVYKEAQVHCPGNISLSRIIQNPDIESLERYFPNKPFFNSDTKTIPLLVRTNFFPCGGTVVAICFSHKFGDASSAGAFINTWAAIARGVPLETVQHPIFCLPRLSPHKDNMPKDTGTIVSKIKMVGRSFVFSRESLELLKSRVITSGSKVDNPTRVEALVAFIWNHVKEAVAKSSQNARKIAGVGIVVNLRQKIVPPLSEYSMGNIRKYVYAISSSENKDVVGLVRGLKEKFNAKRYVNGHLGEGKSMPDVWNGEIEVCSFTSLIHFQLYEVDFGWGKPSWFSHGTFQLRNHVLLLKTSSGDGIEALINMLPQDMDFLEHDLDFLSLTTLRNNGSYLMPKL